MAAMFRRLIAVAVAVLAGSLLARGALAGPPARYVPAPSGKIYYLLFGNGSTMGTFTSAETAAVSGHLVAGSHTYESEWTNTLSEIGATFGCGVGSVGFLPSVDISAYIPFYFRSYRLTKYLVTSDPTQIQAGYAMATLHGSLMDPESGSGIGDITLSGLALLYGDNASGTWISSTLRVSLATSPSAHERFARILHGDAVAPSSGDGVSRLVPAISMLKTVAGQRAYIDIEYALPLQGKENFTFTSPTLWVTPSTPYDDASRSFADEIKPAGVALGTLGVETSLNLFGVVPAIEMNVRMYQAASWKENGRNVLDTSTMSFPNLTPGFVTTGAWTVGSLPLKSNTEVEAALIGIARFKASDVLKFGVSYITSSFGNSIGFRVAFVSLFLERPQSDRGVPGRPEAREVEVSPVLDAPLAPAALVKTGVSFPMFGAGISQEEASWVAGQLRGGMRRLRGYDLMSEKDMEQLAYEPCGDADCGTRYARALKLQAYVVSRLEKSGSGFSLGVQMINVADGTVASSDSVSAASLEDLRGQIPAVLDRLTKPQAAPATR